MRKLKVMTIIGTRPDIIKLSEIIKSCDLHFEHTLVHTGQNYDYELNQAFFDDLCLRAPDFYLNVAGSHLGETMGNVLAKSYELLANERPDALLVLGDTNSALCVISAKRLKIPIFHLEAGNRCFDENLPEEVNRRIVDHTSDVNLCYTEHARRYLYAEGVRKEYTFVVGSPMKEVLDKNRQTIEASDVLSRLSLDSKQFILVSAHREENIDIESSFWSLMNALNALAEHYDMPVIYSVHPRSDKFIKARGFVFHPNVQAMKPFNFSDYVTLQKNAYCVVSDSGTLPEEASYFRFPAVSIRTSTERPEAMDKGNFILGGLTEESLLQAVELTVRMHEIGENGTVVPDYSDDNVSAKVVGIIQGYVGVINRMVWRK
ncbi:non-hydrolyzing UDP-N-acetylglucosamine 2-epimerase [Cohnella zeiphila]|uniref:UDP-N-acetylglucosamine 2-epimerase (Non-hydrolyzing) n=1 Tax=Cohnella zeiphila TaxID=2761120 RepID=A0A7X0SLT5_9BACL|nr:UDP-N-acetylglucosamine 2-epimerase (non-hydrolyzing) [Cohnella zeiphila]MBB6732236.1 UDP-N-acetylglucosamine 2-epimerase (non-hydrolyzing) [Cohnella zeiphila]